MSKKEQKVVTFTGSQSESEYETFFYTFAPESLHWLAKQGWQVKHIQVNEPKLRAVVILERNGEPQL